MGPFVDFCWNHRRFFKWQGVPDRFLEAMPENWWADFHFYQEHSKDCMELFVMTEQDKIVAGGIVMEGLPPDMKIFEKRVGPFIEKGYLYIGFLFVVKEYRGQDIGSTWLRCIKGVYGANGFWLTVEEPGLIGFYKKNGFRWEESLTQGQRSEELLIFEPSNELDRFPKSFPRA
ncbi:MAG: GNAT family N-acetyltransferase [Allomuricauda sp.]